jgi:hypothetical protein
MSIFNIYISIFSIVYIFFYKRTATKLKYIAVGAHCFPLSPSRCALFSALLKTLSISVIHTIFTYTYTRYTGADMTGCPLNNLDLNDNDVASA